MFSAVFFGLWYAAALGKALAAGRMWRNRLSNRFPLIWASLVFASLRSGVLAYFFTDRSRHEVIYAVSAPFILLIEGAAMVECFWALTEHYPNFRRPGVTLLGSLALIGALAALLTGSIAVPEGWWVAWWWQSHGLGLTLLIKRYALLIMVVVLGGTMLLLPRIDGIPIRPSAIRAARILAFQVSSGLVISWISVWLGPTLFAYFAPLVAGLAASLFWLFYLTPASDRCGVALPFALSGDAEHLPLANRMVMPARGYFNLMIASAVRWNVGGTRSGVKHPE